MFDHLSLNEPVRYLTRRVAMVFCVESLAVVLLHENIFKLSRDNLDDYGALLLALEDI